MYIAQNFLDEYFVIAEIDQDVADLAAGLRKHSKATKLADSIVMASALVHQATLVTLDQQLKK